MCTYSALYTLRSYCYLRNCCIRLFLHFHLDKTSYISVSVVVVSYDFSSFIHCSWILKVLHQRNKDWDGTLKPPKLHTTPLTSIKRKGSLVPETVAILALEHVKLSTQSQKVYEDSLFFYRWIVRVFFRDNTYASVRTVNCKVNLVKTVSAVIVICKLMMRWCE